ncbi:MAG: type II toxin-antitoxin system RelE/ParE family toxin [Chryseotalea sp. WA131a]|jgi:plasmid stabilization system protein ParE|nr:MAG: type II toxin-antitoxin system RelE/ParE family toxin [Chryseotalea sp. WA131a]
MDRHSIYRTIFSSKAQREIAESWNWYEDRQLGLGDRFLNEIAEHIRKIEQTPIKFPIRFKSYRETPVPVFPFLIIYRINGRKRIIRIVSIFHTSRNPTRKY